MKWPRYRLSAVLKAAIKSLGKLKTHTNQHTFIHNQAAVSWLDGYDGSESGVS
jgi:hypothetical protein